MRGIESSRVVLVRGFVNQLELVDGCVRDKAGLAGLAGLAAGCWLASVSVCFGVWPVGVKLVRDDETTEDQLLREEQSTQPRMRLLRSRLLSGLSVDTADDGRLWLLLVRGEFILTHQSMDYGLWI